MALPSSGQISMNQVNVELGLGGTTQISLNQASVRTLFQKASGAISLNDGHGKSNAVAPAWRYGTPGGNGHNICEWNNFDMASYVTGTGPFTVELIMYSNGCSNAYTIFSNSQGTSGQYYDTNNPLYVSANNGAAYNDGSYTGGTPYKAAHYKLQVSNSAGSIISYADHVNYGYCEVQYTCSCGEDCVENCCDVDCSGDCVTGYMCRGECSWSDFEYCINNNCPCWPSACGYTCTCWCGYDYNLVYQYTNYSPNGSCS